MNMKTACVLAAVAGQIFAHAAIAQTAPGAAAAGVPDAQKSCEQLAAEIGQQQQIIADANSSSTTAQVADVGLGIAQSVGIHFGGFGIGGLQATGAASSLAQQQKQAADQKAQQADIRLQVLTAFYQGKGC
ncbi:MAG: hypothetical protein CVT81_08650 [Alphaproteobacteria bacterium HGW-Alphaproteobacteria-3]|nr:MAG: hypothetical protein CVT81_08650 [Alphaproteobacteria bacterium HGW-Alphaproteobacteria-3]